MTKAATINSRAKGASAEREFARLVLAETGVRMVRNLEQSRGGGYDLEAGDDQHPVTLSLRRYAIEIKRYAEVTPGLLAQFWQQAERQAREADRIPLLAYRANRREWRVLVPLSAINAEAFGLLWGGIEWTAELSIAAFCALVREGAQT